MRNVGSGNCIYQLLLPASLDHCRTDLACNEHAHALKFAHIHQWDAEKNYTE